MKTTKNILIGVVAILTLLLFFQACDKISYTEFEGTHVLEKNMAKQVVAEGKQVWIEVKELTDSRCPINANCVWQGAAQVKFVVNTDTEEKTLELCLGGCDVVSKNHKQELLVNAVKYSVELVDVTPYPTTDKILQTSKATILIQKK